MRKVKWRWDYGCYVCFCPYCDEPSYEKDRCVFCGKPYKWVEPKHKPTIVEVGEYTIVQATNNHIQLFKGERSVMHVSCTAKKTEDELKEMVALYEELANINIPDKEEDSNDNRTNH